MTDNSVEKSNLNDHNIPKLRFPEFDKEWKEMKLADILTFYSTNSFSREKLNYEEGTVKNIHYGDIHTKYPSILSLSKNNKVPYINNDVDLSKFKEEQYLQNGDLIIADASEDYEDIGKAIEVTNIDDEKVLAGLHTILARDEKGITVDGFKAYLFSVDSFKTKIKVIANGISVLGISKNNISKLNVNIPTKQEQQKIVDLLSLTDKKIQVLNKKHQVYQDFKKYLLQNIFAQKLRFNFEEEWKEYTLNKISEKIGDGLHSTPQYIDDSEFFFINGNNLDNKQIVITESTKCVPFDEYEKYKKDLSENTILISINGTIGNLAYYNNEKVMLGKSAAYINLKPSINKEFIYNYLQTNKIKNFFQSELTGTTIKNLSLKTLKNTKIKLPNLEEQNKIANSLSVTDNKINLLQDQLSHMEDFKRGLLQSLFI